MQSQRLIDSSGNPLENSAIPDYDTVIRPFMQKYNIETPEQAVDIIIQNVEKYFKNKNPEISTVSESHLHTERLKLNQKKKKLHSNAIALNQKISEYNSI